MKNIELLKTMLALPLYTGVSIDTRTLVPGDLFIALDGPNFQGHRFTQEALAKGACAVVQAHENNTQDPRVLWVSDSLALLQYIARDRRKKFRGLCYAVTGSVGKTTTKEGLVHVLKHFGPTHASVSSYNNHIGVPLTLANCPPEARYGIFEVGTNHPGEIEELVSYVQPDVSILTAISEAHIENFQTLKAIAEEKFKIFSGKIGILPTHCPFIEVLNKKNLQWITYGIEEGDVHCKKVNFESKAQALLHVYTPWGEISYRPSSWCSHWIEGNLGILAALSTAGVDLQEASRYLSSFSPLKGRGAFIYYDSLDIGCIDESYNAAPLAMRACIQAFGLSEVPGRKILLLGEMGELGDHGPRLHEELIPFINAVGAEHIFLVGALFQESAFLLAQKGASVHWGLELFLLLDTIKFLLLPKDTLLVKGKNSANMCQIFSWLESWNAVTFSQENDWKIRQ
ncbi:UDP-N-acetylmuramoyl-tripeptide--D-alanyl-D-alanine ligase [Holospora curviuscula]|uniref:UDP-N-acetylmuramoyl-tripeptide--D-alanyl-D-alanine ligase n=1 Tax=Holospora curviuscula TaxID=1082868 RepID=A0A2S5RA78_9PROT|nr:UDP-N-acetylmuramoyl-tripeptide--D-alanyl-D-alanine ligase [Holospora curviuscula]PPE04236.1 UDP-N-acetylmuramoyl-tripeptide--D-alanyl-D-alanine ligase [Holospora curviuscula]